MLAQEVLDLVGNLSTAKPTPVETIDEIVYKLQLVRDNLLDAVELLNDLDRD